MKNESALDLTMEKGDRQINSHAMHLSQSIWSGAENLRFTQQRNTHPNEFDFLKDGEVIIKSDKKDTLILPSEGCFNVDKTTGKWDFNGAKVIPSLNKMLRFPPYSDKMTDGSEFVTNEDGSYTIKTETGHSIHFNEHGIIDYQPGEDPRLRTK